MSLWLRDITDADVPTLFEQQRDPVANQVAAFGALNPDDRDAFVAKWAKILGDDSSIKKAIVVDGQVVGNVLCFIAPWSGKLEVSYWIGRDHWGKGIATKALAELLKLVTTRPLHARATKDNVGSIRVLTKCGFTIIGEERGFSHIRGEEIDEVLFVLETNEPEA